MENTKIVIKTKSKSYPIYFGDRILSTAGKIVKKILPNVKKIAIISDKNIPSIFLKKLSKSLRKYKLKIYKIVAKEKTKSFKVANKLIEKLLHNNLNRSDCIISLGGGIIGDLSAFVSNLTKRGIKFVNILAEKAEELNHHPDLIIGWCEVSVSFTSHDQGGVTSACLKMAKAVEKL